MKISGNELLKHTRKELEEMMSIMESRYIQAIDSNNVSELEEFYEEFWTIQNVSTNQKMTNIIHFMDKLILIGRMIEMIHSTKEIIDGKKLSILMMTCPSKLKEVIKVIGERKTGVIVSDVLGENFSMESNEIDILIERLNTNIVYSPIECIKGDELNLYFLSKIGQKFYDKYLVRQGD